MQNDVALLLDSDILVYRCGFAVEKRAYHVEDTQGAIEYIAPTHKEAVEYVRRFPNKTFAIEYCLNVEPLSHALQNVNTVIATLREAFPNAELRSFLTGKNNYRHNLAKIQPYKGNRSAFSKPVHYDAIRKHLIDAYDSVVVDGMEADDALGIQSTMLAQAGSSPIIVSIDKDLDMIPGRHYNWVKKEAYEVTDEEGFRNFYRQCLTGDSVDYVPGIEGIGPKRAGKILANCGGPSAMLHAVREAWRAAYPKGVPTHTGGLVTAEQALLEVGRLLWIKRSTEEGLWDFDGPAFHSTN